MSNKSGEGISEVKTKVIINLFFTFCYIIQYSA